MKKLLVILAIGAFAACNNASETTEAAVDSIKTDAEATVDSIKADAGAALDSVQNAAGAAIDSAKKQLSNKLYEFLYGKQSLKSPPFGGGIL